MFRKEVTVSGVTYIQASLEYICQRLIAKGGLLVAPSGPGLAQDFPKNPFYREALIFADIVLPDSGYMVLLWNLMQSHGKMERISGLKFLKYFVEKHGHEIKSSCWVMPNKEQRNKNLEWLNGSGLSVDEGSTYIAPIYNRYGKIEDHDLLAKLEAEKPQLIVLNVGGGVQECLGHFLRQNLSYRPIILCTGAALAFLSGIQASIPSWADRYYMGWLMRCLQNPGVFIPRYWHSFSLAIRMLKEISFGGPVHYSLNQK